MPHRDPFNLVQNNSAEKKARGLKSEILNGRAAMVGLMGLLESDDGHLNGRLRLSGLLSPGRQMDVLVGG